MIAVYIAFQQYKTNRFRVKLELFDKRHELYSGIRDYLYSVIREGYASDTAIFALNKSTQDAFFLFDEEVEAYIQQLRERGARTHLIRKKLEILPVGEERSALAEEDAEILIWFGNQLGESKRILKKYLQLVQ
ncbi:MAG: hypothetical protein AAGN64_00820 [Bacteroidota bacterium]